MRVSLSESLLDYLTRNPKQREEVGDSLYDLLLEGGLAGLEELCRSLFAGVPHHWHTKNPIRHSEEYHASVIYAHFPTQGRPVILEESSSQGRLDMSMRLGGKVYLFELRVVERAGERAALARLKARTYVDKYGHLGEPIHLVGVEFSEAKRACNRS